MSAGRDLEECAGALGTDQRGLGVTGLRLLALLDEVTWALKVRGAEN